MDKFLERYNLSSWNWEEIEDMNRPITNNEVASVIKKQKQNNNFQQTKDQMASQVDSTKDSQKS